MSGSAPVRVLCVEDEPVLAIRLKRGLEKVGFEVDLAYDGDDGLAIWNRGSYDALVVDHVMPRMQGIEMLRALCARGELPVTIFTTAFGDEQVAVEAMKLGVDDYLVKDVAGAYVELIPKLVEAGMKRRALLKEKACAEEALRTSEARMRLITDSLPVLIAYIDSQCRFQFVNKTYERWWRKPAQDIEGRLIEEVLPPSAYEKIRPAIEMVLAGNLTTYETSISYADGVTRDVRIVYAPQFDSRNQITGFAALTVDQTDLKTAQDELRKARDELDMHVQERTAELLKTNEELQTEIVNRKEAEKRLETAFQDLQIRSRQLEFSETRFKTIVESALDCIFIKGCSLRYMLVNPSMENLLRITASNILGKTDEELFAPGEGFRADGVDRRVLEGETVEFERVALMGGDHVTLLESRVPIRNPDGEIVGICGISRNISERKRRPWVPNPGESASRSPAMRRALGLGRAVAATKSTVLLTGESGSGKDHMARYIHEQSKRALGPFFTVNCAALPQELAESELFGHEAGAFTGANRLKRGLLELAEGGTLLLNEIGELTLRLQAKLLTFLDTMSFMRVGGHKSVSVDARLITATNRNLEDEVSRGQFRSDLFHRLNVVTIHVPPLRERKEDLPDLVKSIVAEMAGRLQLHSVPDIDELTVEKMSRYRWPGNVRELRNVVERGLILCQGDRLNLDVLGLLDAPTGSSSSGSLLPEGKSLTEVITELKIGYVQDALRLAEGNRNQAARLLGITRFSLTRLMKSLGMLPSES